MPNRWKIHLYSGKKPEFVTHSKTTKIKFWKYLVFSNTDPVQTSLFAKSHQFLNIYYGIVRTIFSMTRL